MAKEIAKKTAKDRAPLSVRQQLILDFVRQFLRDHSYPPTVREIGVGTGISSTSVVDYNLGILEKFGHIRRDPEVSRGLELLDGAAAPRKQSRFSAPVVGRIAAGEPIEAVAGHGEYVELTEDLAPRGAYVLRVKGKSMVEDLIDDQDLVVVQPQDTAENGDIVVALLIDGPTEHGQATLKRFYREKDRIRLQPANAEMSPIYVEPDGLRIQGKVVSVIRQLR